MHFFYKLRALSISHKIILAVAFPLILYILACVIVDDFDYLYRSWLEWIVLIIIASAFEWNLFSVRNIEKEQKSKHCGSDDINIFEHPYPLRRFFARIFDYIIFSWLMIFLAYLIEFDIYEYLEAYEPFARQMVISMFFTFLWIPAESFLVSKFGTTPGKYIFGISISAWDNSRLNFYHAVVRSCKVWVKGLGLGIPIISLFCCINAYSNLTRDMITTWDKEEHILIRNKYWETIDYIKTYAVVIIILIIEVAIQKLTSSSSF